MIASEIIECLYMLHMKLVARNPAFRMVLCYDGDQLPPVNGLPLYRSEVVWERTRVVALQQPQRQNREDCDIRKLVTDAAKGGEATDRCALLVRVLLTV